MIRAHLTAARDLVAASPDLFWLADYVAQAHAHTLPASGAPVFDGDVPTGEDEPDIYVALYMPAPARGPRQRLSVAVPKSMLVMSTLVRGASKNECAWAVEKLHAALIGQRLNVSGRRCDPFLPPESSSEIRLDDSINPPAWVCTEAWPFYTSPTP